MKKVLVTGATGCVGSNLVAELLNRGFGVRAFHRPNSNSLTLAGLDVEHCLGDIRDKEALSLAMAGCDTVFHTAAIVSFWKKRREEQLDINVNGTKTVVELSLRLGVSKLVHTSSVAALGRRPDGGIVDESVAYNLGTTVGYKWSKHQAEIEVLRGIERGLAATVVNPTVIIGPRDPYFHGGQIVRDVKRGLVPAYIAGGMNIVSVYDVVSGHLAAATKGKTGERYILGGENLSHREVFRMAARVVHGRPPLIKVPIWVLKSIATISDLFADLLNITPWISSELVAGAGKNQWYSSDKAARELDYRPTSVERAMRDACDWYVANGLI